MAIALRTFLTGKRRAAAAGAVLLTAAAAGYRFMRPGAPAPQGSAKVERGGIEVHFADSGELAPKLGVDVASKVSGRVIELAAEEGRRVRQGQRLAVIQPGRTEAERFVPFTVTSPIDGVVMRWQRPGTYQEEARLARLGDYVTGLLESTNPTYLMTVADLSTLVVRMKISEMDILKLAEGMPVKVDIDALPGESFPAKVALISPQAEKDSNNLKSFRVEVSLLKADRRLKPGMTARVDGLLESRKGIVKLPLAAVFEERGKEIVFVPDPDGGLPRRVPVRLGLRSDTEAEVLEGPKEGERLLAEKPSETSEPGSGGGPGAGGGRGARRFLRRLFR